MGAYLSPRHMLWSDGCDAAGSSAAAYLLQTLWCTTSCEHCLMTTKTTPMLSFESWEHQDHVSSKFLQHGIAMAWPRQSMALPRHCNFHGIVIRCHGNAMTMPWQLAWHCNGVTVASPWQGHGIAMTIPWHCRGIAVAMLRPEEILETSF